MLWHAICNHSGHISYMPIHCNIRAAIPSQFLYIASSLSAFNWQTDMVYVCSVHSLRRVTGLLAKCKRLTGSAMYMYIFSIKSFVSSNFTLTQQLAGWASTKILMATAQLVYGGREWGRLCLCGVAVRRYSITYPIRPDMPRP